MIPPEAALALWHPNRSPPPRGCRRQGDPEQTLNRSRRCNPACARGALFVRIGNTRLLDNRVIGLSLDRTVEGR